jgi:sodium-dependent dicarboxylate transporter 2/3/5
LAPSAGGLSVEAKRAAAIAVLMAVWWITECLPIGATALVPLALYPLLSIMNAADTARRYADPTIFLFMGGFMIALAMQKWGLHKRLALFVIAAVGGGPRRMLGGFLFATAFISMWVSNTATAMMMLPIAMAVVQQLSFPDEGGGAKRYRMAVMLSIAYASSIGGVATLIGTPPNMIFAGQARALLPEMPEVSFLQWFSFAFPLAFGFLLIAWAYLAFIVARGVPRAAADKQWVIGQLRALGPWSKGEAGVMAVFVLTALAWITRESVTIGSFVLPGWADVLQLEGVHDGTVAIIAGLLLFLTPVDLAKGDFLLDWEWAKKLPWEILLLFGGGFALAESFQVTGLASWIGGGFHFLQHLPRVWLILILCLATTFLSELMSNTAQTTMMMPVLAAASATLGFHPYLLMVPATIACSMAFMMPVGTPPNAVVFGSGQVTIPQMAKAGFALNILGALWIVLMTFVLMGPVFGLEVNLR